MKTQLLMIIAVIASSLLTLSQDASAKEISQLRWLEPNVEQGLGDLIVADQDQEPGQGSLPRSETIEQKKQLSSSFALYAPPAKSLRTAQIYPRAPPISLI